MSNPAELERVLREDDWLRRIARRLAGDPDAAEDLAQDAWVAALASGRRDRPWLFGVVRNLRRAGARRAARDESLREERLATADVETGTAPATDEVVDELLLRKRVTDGLLELDEPYRTTLYRRFVQGQRLGRIARESGVAVSTVHQRVDKGLALLRARLDDGYGGKRRAWALGLLSLARPEGLVLPIGGLVVGTSVKVAAAVVVAAGAWLWFWQGREPVERVADAAPAVVTVDEAAPAPVAPPAEPRREQAPAVEAPETSVVSGEAATELAALLHGLVVDLEGRPVGTTRVGYEDPGELPAHEAATVSDGLGAFVLPARDQDPLPGEDVDARITSLEPDLVTLVHGVPRDGTCLVVVGRAVSFAGEVVDPEGTPLPGAELRFELRQSLFREHGVVRPWTNATRRIAAVADEHGRFRLTGACGGAHVGLWAGAEGFEARFADLPAGGDTSLRIVLEPDDGERILEGVVLDPRGAGVPGASVSAGLDVVRTDDDGTFRLAWKLSGAGHHVKGEDGVWRPFRDTSVLRALKAGYLPAEVEVATLALDETIVLRLGDEPPALRLRVLDQDGEPRAGVVVWASDLTAFGTHSQSAGEARAVSTVYLEERLSPDRAGRGQVTDAGGLAVLPGFLPRPYQVRANDPATATTGGPWEVFPGEETTLTLSDEAGTERVAGRVVSASGVPIPQVWIVPRRGTSFNDGLRPPHVDGVALGTRTDEEGRFAFEALATEGTVLEMQHDSFFIEYYGLEGKGDLGDLEIVQPMLCELQVEPRDPELASEVVVLDADGEPLELLVSMGAFLTMSDVAGIDGGKTSVIQVSETARTLVLKKDDVEVLRRPLRLDPAERTVVRP